MVARRTARCGLTQTWSTACVPSAANESRAPVARTSPALVSVSAVRPVLKSPATIVGTPARSRVSARAMSACLPAATSASGAKLARDRTCSAITSIACPLRPISSARTAPWTSVPNDTESRPVCCHLRESHSTVQ